MSRVNLEKLEQAVVEFMRNGRYIRFDKSLDDRSTDFLAREAVTRILIYDSRIKIIGPSSYSYCLEYSYSYDKISIDFDDYEGNLLISAAGAGTVNSNDDDDDGVTITITNKS